MGAVKAINQDQFQSEVLSSTKPVLVDFWAPWCGPCKALAPVLDEVSTELGDSAQIVKIDVDANGDIAEEYGIRSIPTLIFFKGGKPQKTLFGAQPKNEISKSLKELI